MFQIWIPCGHLCYSLNRNHVRFQGPCLSWFSFCCPTSNIYFSSGKCSCAASIRDNTGRPMLDNNVAEATPYAYGSGHIRPNLAMDPGLVYDLTTNDYLNFLCASGYKQTQIKSFAPYICPYVVKILDFNYPSITIPKLYGSVTVTRKLKNVGTPGTYAARLRVPAGLSISVEPNALKFDKIGEEKSFQLTIEVTRPGVATTFGELTWSDGKHYVRSPIVVGGVMA